MNSLIALDSYTISMKTRCTASKMLWFKGGGCRLSSTWVSFAWSY